MNLPLKLKGQADFTSNPINLCQLKRRTQAKSISVAQTSTNKTCKMEFKTLEGCTLGISRYPNFEYNAQGGGGKGVTISDEEDQLEGEISALFDPNELYIPPLSSATTKFLGLPLPPFLKIEIVPELFKGRINTQSGKVELEFKAKFLFSAGSIYRAPPLVVVTVLTSDESKGEMRSGKGQRMDKEGKCRLVGVARVDPIDDFLMNTFLQLPTECIAELNAVVSLSDQAS